jgi:hypothetical protein
MAIAARQAIVDMDESNNCVPSKEFLNCYKLSMAKLALEAGVMAN